MIFMVIILIVKTHDLFKYGHLNDNICCNMGLILSFISYNETYHN